MVFFIREKLINNLKDITILAEISGGEKTSIVFEIVIQRWSIYIDFFPSAEIYDDYIGEELNNIRIINLKFEHYD